MHIAAKIALGTVGSGVAGASGFGIYELIKPKTIGERLLWEGRELLGTGDKDDEQEWKTLKEKYSNSSPANTDKFKDDKNQDKEFTSENDLKNHCKTILNKKITDDPKGEDLKQARFWCVKNSEKKQ